MNISVMLSCPRRAPMVTAMWSHERKVRSLAKKVLGSMRMGVVRASGRASAGRRSAARELNHQSIHPALPFSRRARPKPAVCRHTSFDAGYHAQAREKIWAWDRGRTDFVAWGEELQGGLVAQQRVRQLVIGIPPPWLVA